MTTAYRFDPPPTDPTRVTLDEPRAISYWMRQLGCSESRLRAAIEQVGDGLHAVHRQLRG